MDLVLFWTVFRSAHVVRRVFVVSYSACSNKVGFPVDCYISIYIYIYTSLYWVKCVVFTSVCLSSASNSFGMDRFTFLIFFLAFCIF